jgi:LysR family transcriptional regulator, hydrogen peroxide-inducible genes activator
MTLQELRFLIALAQEKHFRKASEVCFVSQPSLSIAIRKLEDELGVTLFERNKNEVKVTALGKEVVDRAKRVLEEIEDIKLTVLSDKDQLKSVFKLGAIFTIGPYLLPPLITGLHKAAPDMPLEIQEDYTANLRKKLLSGDVDAILVSHPFSAPGIVTRTVYKEPFVVLMPAKHPLTKFKGVNETELKNYNVLLLGEGHCFRDQVISSCPHCFSSLNSTAGVNWKTVEGSSIETIRHMVASGLGITILPLSAAGSGAYRSSMLTTRPLKGAHPERVISLAWRQTFPRIKAIELILQVIQRAVPV